MRKVKYYFMAVLFTTIVSLADSPLTSTDFYKAYLEVEIVKNASESDGILNKEFMRYLNSDENPIANKLAMINALSWDIDGKKNFEIYLEYLLGLNDELMMSNYTKILSGEKLICLAYLKALDNYFEVDEALNLADLAVAKSPKLFSIFIIRGLIAAQKEYKDHLIYKAVSDVKNNAELVMDMKKEAVEIIFEYMDLYK